MLYPEPYEIGSVEKGKLLTSGNLKFHNELIKISNHSLWEIQGTDVALDYYLHGFSWLNDLAAVGSYEALKLAQEWVFHWTLNELGNKNLCLDLLTQRLFNWINHSGFLLKTSNLALSDSYMKSIDQQSFFLEKRWQSLQKDVDRIKAIVLLISVGIYITNKNYLVQSFIKALDKTVPQANDDHYVIKKGENFSADSINGTLHNDYDSGGDVLTTILLDSTLHGEVNFKKDGSFTYIPEDYYVESDTFRYVVTDGLYYDTAEVTLARLVSGVDIASIIEINPIYFDLNKSNIREDAATELLKIVKIMNDYTSMVVELGSHTDCRASQTYNRNLSDRRAKSSANFIKERISNPQRIYGKGFGESKLKNKCECEGSRIIPCSEKEHQVNRRTEFLIVKM